MITSLPGAVPMKPGSATVPFFGVAPKVFDETGQAVPKNTGGKLVITQPWPSMLRTLWNDNERYKSQYWSEFKNTYFTGDGCRRDEDGYYWITGRTDDVLNVSGHRMGTAEVESALVAHDNVAEAAVVGYPHEIKGQGLAAFVTLVAGETPSDALKAELVSHVAQEIDILGRTRERYAPGRQHERPLQDELFTLR